MGTTPKPNEAPTKPIKTSNVPAADIEFGAVLKKVSEKWILSNWLTLQWITAIKFKSDADAYNAALAVRINTGKSRPQITKALKNIYKEIDEKLANVKSYLAEKYGKEDALSYYPSFGIEFYNKRYIYLMTKTAALRH